MKQKKKTKKTKKNQRTSIFLYKTVATIFIVKINVFTFSDITPFDTKHREKTAVKFGILRVVMLWPSQDRILPTEKQVTHSPLEASYWTSQ